MTSLRHLEEQANSFASRLTQLLNSTVTVEATVTSFVIPESGVAHIAPGAKEDAPGFPSRPIVPLSLAPDPAVRAGARLWLRLWYRGTMDSEDKYLAVTNSSFGLCINPDPKSQLCAIRIEFDRGKKSHAAAHIQIHGMSPEFTYAYATKGQLPRELHKLAFPVGGRRYRPSLEDFIEFLHDAELVDDVHPGWQQALDASRREFQERQLRAAIRNNPEIAVAALEDEGYRVEPPTDQN